MHIQETKAETFQQDSSNGFGDNNGTHSNGFTSNAFGNSSAFDSRFSAPANDGFEDSFGNSFNTKPIANDPFGDKSGGIPAVTPDVCSHFIFSLKLI